MVKRPPRKNRALRLGTAVVFFAAAAALLFYFFGGDTSARFYAVLCAAVLATGLIVLFLSHIGNRLIKYILPLLLMLCAGGVFLYAFADTQDFGRTGVFLFAFWIQISGAVGLLEAVLIDVLREFRKFRERTKK